MVNTVVLCLVETHAVCQCLKATEIVDKTSNTIICALFTYLQGLMNMVTHKCPTVILLPMYMKGLQSQIKSLYKRAFPT